MDMEEVNWEALETADGDLDVFLESIAEDYPEKQLLEFLAFTILPADDDEEQVLSSDDAQVLGFMRLKAMLDAILLPVA